MTANEQSKKRTTALNTIKPYLDLLKLNIGNRVPNPNDAIAKAYPNLYATLEASYNAGNPYKIGSSAFDYDAFIKSNIFDQAINTSTTSISTPPALSKWAPSFPDVENNWTGGNSSGGMWFPSGGDATKIANNLAKLEGLSPLVKEYIARPGSGIDLDNVSAAELQEFNSQALNDPNFLKQMGTEFNAANAATAVGATSPAISNPSTFLGGIKSTFGNTFKALGTQPGLQTASSVLQGIGAGISAYTGLKQLDLAEDAFKFQKYVTLTNLRNEANAYNLALEERERGRRASGTSLTGLTPQETVNKYGASGGTLKTA